MMLMGNPGEACMLYNMSQMLNNIQRGIQSIMHLFPLSINVCCQTRSLQTRVRFNIVLS